LSMFVISYHIYTCHYGVRNVCVFIEGKEVINKVK